MESIESRLNLSETKGDPNAIFIETNMDRQYYQQKLIEYCEEKGIDYSDDNCSDMIMKDFTPDYPATGYWFWIDPE